MCGRFTANVKKKDLEEEWNLAVPNEFKPRYNIAPSQWHPIAGNFSNAAFEMFNWGLILEWASTDKKPKTIINTRIESIAESKIPVHTPCLIPATSWFEWFSDKSRQPFLIAPAQLKLFAFAGICHTQPLGKNNTLKSFSIITTAAAAPIAHLHHRMPLIIEKNNYYNWINNFSVEIISQLIEHANNLQYHFYPVSSLVNKTGNDSSDILKEFRETLF